MLRTVVRNLAPTAVLIRRDPVTVSGGIDLSAATPKHVADFTEFANLNGRWKVEQVGSAVNPRRWWAPWSRKIRLQVGDYVGVNLRDRASYTPLELGDDAMIVVHSYTAISARLDYEEHAAGVALPPPASMAKSEPSRIITAEGPGFRASRPLSRLRFTGDKQP